MYEEYARMSCGPIDRCPYTRHRVNVPVCATRTEEGERSLVPERVQQAPKRALEGRVALWRWRWRRAARCPGVLLFWSSFACVRQAWSGELS